MLGKSSNRHNDGNRIMSRTKTQLASKLSRKLIEFIDVPFAPL